MPPRKKKVSGGEYEIAGNFMEDVDNFASNYVAPAIHTAETVAPYVAKYGPMLLGLGKRVQELNDRLDRLEGAGMSGGARNAGVNGFKKQQEDATLMFNRNIPKIAKKNDWERAGENLAQQMIARDNRERKTYTRAESARKGGIETGGEFETGGAVGRSPYHDIINSLRY
jgi:hypothetical protein